MNPRDSLRQQFAQVRSQTGALCKPLEAEDFVIQSMPETSPPKWHLAHTTWFFETFVLAHANPELVRFDPAYMVLFNSYYQTVGCPHPRDRRGILSRPTTPEVLRYRSSIDEQVEALMDSAPEQDWDELSRRITLGLHHEQQHQELLLMDVKHNFFCNPMRPAYRQDLPQGSVEPANPDVQWVPFDGGISEIGFAGEGFCFDNETPRHRALLGAFELASRPVSNREWLAFVDDGGYRQCDLWLSDGWATAVEQGWTAPLYWERTDAGWQQFTLSGMKPLALDEPVVHVSYFEADAFARWSGARLPTEQEWERAAAGIEIDGNTLDAGLLAPRATGGQGLVQLFGDVWEWTQSPYSPYPGFRPLPGSLGEYNGKFMCNQFVLRGGSCVTSQSHLRVSYRNFFYPHERWNHNGVRLARDPR